MLAMVSRGVVDISSAEANLKICYDYKNITDCGLRVVVPVCR